MNILVYGAGVIGTLYAARLRDGGHRVTVLARGQRLADIRCHGLVLENILSGVRSGSRSGHDRAAPSRGSLRPRLDHRPERSTGKLDVGAHGQSANSDAAVHAEQSHRLDQVN